MSHLTLVTHLPNNSTSHDLLLLNFHTILSVFNYWFVRFLYNYLLLLCHNVHTVCVLISNSVLDSLNVVCTRIQQTLLHVVHFVFYMFLLCVTVFRNASVMYSTVICICSPHYSISLNSFIISEEFGDFGP
jgi:hypothetical protein